MFKRARRCLLPLAALAMLAASPAFAGPISPSLSASRVSGAAPLAVHFDATGTSHADTSTDAFHDLTYEWNFGDDRGAHWSAGANRSNKNTDCCGPVAAHVFEDASGSPYTVSLTITDAAGNRETQQLVIHVTDQDAQWSGSKTICVNPHNDDDFSGCPSGASQHESSSGNDFAQTLNGLTQSDRRILFKRGGTWDANSRHSLPAGPGLLGAYGSGVKPVIRYSRTFTGVLSAGNDWRITNLDVRGVGAGFPDLSHVTFQVDSAARHVLFFRNETRDVGRSFNFYSDQFANARKHLFIMENETRNGGQTVNGSGGSFAVMGNSFDRVGPGGGEHIMRLYNSEKLVMAHNYLVGAQMSKHLIKMHTQDLSFCTNHNVISDNDFEFDGAGTWLVSLGPQNTNRNECVEDIIVERNAVRGKQVFVQIAARDVTLRNNAHVGGTGQLSPSFLIAKRGSMPSFSLRNIRFFNNSVTSHFAGSGTVSAIRNTDGINVLARQNLFYAPNANDHRVLMGGGYSASSDNCGNSGSGGADCFIQNNPFLSSSPQIAMDLQPEADSDVCAVQTTGIDNTRDFAARERNTTGSIGAWDCEQPAIESGTLSPPILLSAD